MAHRGVWFWRELYRLVVEFCRAKRLPFNRVVNLAVAEFLKGDCDVEELQLRSKLVLLRSREADLRQCMRVMLRSGSYLPQYADRLFREKYDKSAPALVRRGQVPLRALSAKEEDIARRVLAERERIAQEIADVLDQLLPKKRFRLKPSRRNSLSRKRLHDKKPRGR